MIHIVKDGETVNTIAQLYGVSPQRIISDNNIDSTGFLAIGQALLVLVPNLIHNAQQGDTLYSLSAKYGVSVNELLRNNPLLSNDYIESGAEIVITYESDIQPYNAITGGYAYPFISTNLLREILPYMSTLSVFSYGFTSNGNLIGTNDETLLYYAEQTGAEPILVLTPRSGEEAFNNQLINDLVNDPQAQDVLIDELITVMRSKGYKELNMDFEFILPQNRDLYTALIQKLSLRLHAVGLRLSVALAPKVSSDQPGLLYEGIDYAGIGRYADSVFLMTYEWGYKYGPPLAVAPIPSVKRVIEYALTEIPAQKIDLGIPNYAYDWQLPYVRGSTVAETIGYIQAIDAAVRYNAPVQFDEYSKSPFIEYSKDGADHIIWFEDVRSFQAKFDLIKQYGLRGLGFWNLLRPFRAGYLLLNQNFNIMAS